MNKIWIILLTFFLVGCGVDHNTHNQIVKRLKNSVNLVQIITEEKDALESKVSKYEEMYGPLDGSNEVIETQDPRSLNPDQLPPLFDVGDVVHPFGIERAGIVQKIRSRDNPKVLEWQYTVVFKQQHEFVYEEKQLVLIKKFDWDQPMPQNDVPAEIETGAEIP